MNMTTTVNAVDSIPVPSRFKYPWLSMEVGQSFYVPGSGFSFIRQMRVQAARAGKRYGRKFITRSDETGLRIWRDK